MLSQMKLVKRNNVYAGILYEPSTASLNLYNSPEHEMTVGDLRENGVIHRKIMFSMNENNVSSDLKGLVPNYAVEGLKPKEEVNKTIIIKDPICLDPILKYLNFNEDLTARDIKKIYKLLLKSSKFYYKNCELFGISKSKSPFGEHYHTNGKNHPLPCELWEKSVYITRESSKPSVYELLMKK